MSTARSRTSTNVAVNGSRGRFAARIRQVRTWALAHGHVAAPGALALICEVKAARPGEFDTWRLGDVDELLWVELVSWCRTVDMPVPDQVPETLWTYLGYLHGTASFTGDSHPLEALRVPLRTISGLDGHGRPPSASSHPAHRGHPARRTSSPTRRPRKHAAAGLAPIVPLRRHAGHITSAGA